MNNRVTSYRGRSLAQMKAIIERQQEAQKSWIRIEIDFVPPSYERWKDLHWGEQRRLQKKAFDALWLAKQRSGIKSIPTPALVDIAIYKRRAQAGDAVNLAIVCDKLFIDPLCEPLDLTKDGRPRKKPKRGLGLIPDDSAEYITITPVELHYPAEADRTVLIFKPYGGEGRNEKEDKPSNG